MSISLYNKNQLLMIINYKNHSIEYGKLTMKKIYFCFVTVLLIFTINVSVYGQETQILNEQKEKSIQNAFEEMVRLNKTSEMPEKIKLLRFLLSNIPKEESVEDWGKLHAELAMSLLRNPFGDRADNLEQVIKHSELAFQVITKKSNPLGWAALRYNLGLVYSERYYGDRADNLELAIQQYESALHVYTKDNFPEDWAETKYSMAVAYYERISGDRADNVEKAIVLFNGALEIRTKTSFPYKWAIIHKTLGYLYDTRIKQSRKNNLEQSIKHYELALRILSQTAHPKHWASVQMNLGESYRRRTGGDRAGNLEQAIGHFRLALKVYTKEEFPQSWALTLNNLAIAYAQRIEGDKAENQEKAIELLKLVLGVRTEGASPRNWAITQTTLASVYRERIKGNRAENIEESIQHNKLALELLNRESQPEEWAGIHSNLGNAYCDRIRGNRTENIEIGIEYYEKALTVYTRDQFPEDWARVYANLAYAYNLRLRGDLAENKERSINYSQKALEIYSREAFPQAWADVQVNAGVAYHNRIRGDKGDNIDLAIEHFKKAQEVYTREAFPHIWANTIRNLGIAYLDRIYGSKAENIEFAINYLELALKVHTPDRFPEDWALTLGGLASAYRERLHGIKAENLERCVDYHELALQVRTKEAFPELWAGTQNNLGNVYRERIYGTRTDNLQKAIGYYKSALEVFTKASFPLKNLSASYNLGNVHMEIGEWQEACNAYSSVEDIGESFLSLTASEEEQSKVLSSFQRAFDHHAYALARLGDPATSLKVLEKGKARSLRQAILLQKMHSLDLPPNIQEIFTSLRKEMLNLERLLKETSKENSEDYVELAQDLRKKRTEVQKILNGIQIDTELEVEQDLNLAMLFEKCRTVQSSLVLINITPSGTNLLVLFPNKEYVTPVFLDEFTNTQIESYSTSWVRLIQDIENKWTQSSDQQIQILSRLGELLWPKLDQLLQSEKINRVIIIPQGDLFLYPLHATPFVPLDSDEEKSIYPLERYTIVYSPSASIYNQLSNRDVITIKDKQALFIEDPDGNLGFSFAGSRYLSDCMQKKKLKKILLQKSDITSENVLKYMKTAALIHYYGHGYYDWYNPEVSGLKMHSANNEINLLTMDMISQTITNNQTTLVILAACETGVTDINKSFWRDQYIGLPASFLRFGANIVIGSLWAVPNLETCILFKRFYEELFSNGKSICPAEALRRAQLWILNASSKEIVLSENEYLGIEPATSKLRKTGLSISHPSNWAAFYIVGNGFAVLK